MNPAWVSAIAAVVGSTVALIGICLACYQLYNLNKTLRMNSLGVVLTLECEMTARKKSVDEVAVQIRLECAKENPSVAVATILDDQKKGYMENWLNSAERLAFCILRGYLSERDWKTEYRDYFIGLVRDHPEYFGAGSIYTNIIDLAHKWQRQ